MYHNYGKRFFDLALAIPALLALSPLILIVWFFVRLDLGAPMIFKHVRPGLHGKPFTLYKFRTMLDKRDAQYNLLPDAERLTRFSTFLRSTSLDELPELLNVLKGEMSLVGPRPLMMQYLARYNPQQARRHAVNPGLTGWAQVNGRNALTWEQKFAFDVWYVDNVSLALDLKIIALTVWKILRREGINPQGHAIMPEFTGTNHIL